MGIQIINGRNFTGSLDADSFTVLLNEAAVRLMHYKQPLNQIIRWHFPAPQHVKVVGIVKDAVMASPFADAQPTIFAYTPNWSNVITYRLSPTVNTQTAIAQLTDIFNKYNPAYPYQYYFVDESYAAKLDFETLIGKLAACLQRWQYLFLVLVCLVWLLIWLNTTNLVLNTLLIPAA